MNLRILLIATLISQAMMASAGPIVRPASCEQIAAACASADAAACCAVMQCAGDKLPAPDDPRQHDRCQICCCICLFLDSAPAILPTPEKGAAAHAGALHAGEPSFPILTGALAGTLGHTTRPPPSSASLRRALLCCWTI